MAAPRTEPSTPEASEQPLGAGRLVFPRRARLHQHQRMRPPCQGKQRRDQTIIQTSPQLPALCISGRRAFPTGLDSTPMGSSAPLPRTALLPGGPLRRGPRCVTPCTHEAAVQSIPPWHGAPRGHDTERSLQPLGSNLQAASPRAACGGSWLRGGCCHQRYGSASAFISLIAACNTARAQLDS